MNPCRALVVGLVALVFTGCGGSPPEEKTELSERERHEKMAEVGLPGGSVVGAALAVSDSATTRARRMETAVPQPH